MMITITITINIINLLEPPKKSLKAFVIPEKKPFCGAATVTESVKVANRRRLFILQQTES